MKRFLSSLALLFLTVLAAPAVTWYVSTNGSDTTYTGTNAWTNAFLSITNAVVKSSAGDLILVSNGTYYATGLGQSFYNTNYIYLNKAVTLKSFSGNPADTILHGNGLTNRLVMMFNKGAVLDGFTITNGYSGGWDGGGVWVFDGGLITNCVISGNRSDATYNGGGGVVCRVWSGGGTITVANCTISGNAAPNTVNVQTGGGGIWAQSNATVAVIITNCDIAWNTTAFEGAAVCASRNVKIYDSRIYNNTVLSNLYGGGAAVAYYYGGPFLYNCSLSNNAANNNVNWGGGARNCILDHCTVLNNTGYYGGGVSRGIVTNGTVIAGNYAYVGGGVHGSALVYDSVLSNNLAWGVYGGGGINFGGESGVISNCLVINNWAINGGGVACFYLDYANNQRVVNCRIIGNKANIAGGGMFVTLNNAGGTSVVQNCLFANNVATNGGGYYGGGVNESRVISCTFVSNSAVTRGGGVYSSHSFTNCIIASNTASIYPDVSGFTNAFWYCCVPSLALQPGQGNVKNDPGFVDYPGGNYRLAAGSPCIDAGTNLPWMGLACDLDGTNSRIVNGRTDIGCYEYTNGTLSVTFGADRTWALAPSINIFTALASGTNTTGLYYIWDFTADGTPDLEGNDLAVVTNTYAAPGYYSVALTVTNAAGESASLTNLNYLKVGPMTYYVATNGAGLAPYTNWAMAVTSLYAATRMANDGDTVLVSNGAFFAWNPNSSFPGFIDLNYGMTLRSLNGPAYTSVTRTPGINSRVFVISKTNAALVGLTITNGFTTGPYGAPLFQYGGGVYMTGGMISNCVIARNTVTNGGGGIYMNGGLVVNSVIRDNLCSNDGAGILIANAGTVRNCLIVSNRVTAGVAPTALRGGGIYFSAGGTAENCTVVGNLASNVGGGVFCVNGGRVLNSLIVSNSTLSGSSSNWYTNGAAAISFSNCCVIPTNDLTGTGHIQAEPLFVDYANDNFRLGAGSPCVDTGTNQAHWMPAGIDLDGQNRIFNSVVDIGAFERSLFDAAAAPANVQASDGTYVDQVLVTWETNACTNATGYQVFRSLAADPAGADQLSDVSDPSYADLSATNGVIYYYWVRATNAYAVSDLSASNTGWRAIVPPTGVTASDGTITGKVVVTWDTNVCTNATGYYVWRNDSNDAASALNLAAVVGTNYDDTSARSNVSYYYWLQATNATGPGGTNSFSAPDTGYWAQWYYVATNGDDNASGIDWGAPLLTVSNGVMRAQRWAGGGVLVSNGAYTLTATNIFITNAITVRSWNNGALDAADTVVDGNLVTRCFRVSHSNAVVDSLTIRNGTNAVAGGGVYLEKGALLLNCIVSSNYAPDGAGVYVANGTVMGCTVQYNLAFTNQSLAPVNAPSRGGGVFLERNGTISNCLIIGNTVSNRAWQPPVPYYNFSGGGGIGIHIAAGADRCRVYNSLISNNLSWAYGGGIYLWSEVEGTAQTLIQNCTNVNNEALIANVAGGGFGCYVYRTSGIITGGVVGANNATNGSGGGVGAYAGNGPLVYNCLIRGNKAYTGGGAAGVSLFNCTVESNTCTSASYAGGGIYHGSYGIISNCVIRGNRAEAGGGGGIEMIGGGCNIRVLNCAIYDNYAADRGGGLNFRYVNFTVHTQLLQNCVVYGNVATNGGGLYAGTTGAVVSACTIVSNRALVRGGGVHITHGYLTNCIIYSNDCPTVDWKDFYVNAAAATNNIGYCCSSTNIAPHQNCITNEPIFANFAAKDYRLAFGSPCINAGANQDWMWGALDKDGNARILGGAADMGAYEYPLYPQVSPLGITNALASGASTGTLVIVWSGDTNADLNYAASSTNAWIALGVSNGVIAANTTNALWVTNDSVGLAAGTYTGAVLVVTTNSLSALYPPATQTVTVIMTILPPGPPTNVQATDGAYADKVVVTWETNLCTNALGYAVWRSISADTNTAARLSEVSDPSYTDTSATNGVLYYYWVQATNADCFSDLSESNTGYRALAPPMAVAASDGSYSGKVVVTWQTNVCTNALGYSVWRNTANDIASATRLVGAAGTNYDDTSAASNILYYYWVQATNALSQTNTSLGGPDTGYWALTYYVATNGSDANAGISWEMPYASVSNGVIKAQQYRTGMALVSNGTYTLTTNVFVTNSITLRSWNNGELDRTNTILDGGGATRCLYLSNNNAQVSGFSLRNGNGLGGVRSGWGGGIFLAAGVLSNCIVESNYCNLYGGGVNLYYAATNLVMRDCLVRGNWVTNSAGRGGGVYDYGGLVCDSTICGNTSSATAAYNGGGGLYITYGTVRGCVISNNYARAYGGGLFVNDSATVVSNQIVDNISTNNGGGVFGYSLRTTFLMADCTVARNTDLQGPSGGGGMYLFISVYGGGLVTNCVISDNTSVNFGGGIYQNVGNDTYTNTFKIANCVISGNRVLAETASPAFRGGGGIYALHIGGGIENCVITGNVAASSAGGVWIKRTYVENEATVLRNCLVAGNTARFGGGVVLSATTATKPVRVENCTIADNVATAYCGGLWFASGGLGSTVTNTICYSNTAPQDANIRTNTTGYAIGYSCTAPTNHLTGMQDGMLTNAPLFINYAAGDFRLAAGSPCINAGTNDVWMDTALDLGERPRVRYGRVDMGCYEYLLNVKVDGVPMDRILRINGVDQNRVFRISE